jgi:hypothetical protein
MVSLNSAAENVPVKYEETQHAIPTAWRQVLRSIAGAFADKDYRLTRGVPGVAPVSTETAEHIKNSVLGYGATLVDLTDQTWDSSVCIWCGTHWDVLIDLWTQEEGRSDLVLSATVTETAHGFHFKIYMVYVP